MHGKSSGDSPAYLHHLLIIGIAAQGKEIVVLQLQLWCSNPGHPTLQAVEEAADTAGGPVGQALEAAGTLPFLTQSVPVEGGGSDAHGSSISTCAV